MQFDRTIDLGIFSQVNVTNNDQAKLIKNVTEVLTKDLIISYLAKSSRPAVPVEQFIAIEVQECYDNFRIIRAKIVNNWVEVFETHKTSPLIFKRILSIIWNDKKQVNALKKYDELRLELNRERRETDVKAPRRRSEIRALTRKEDNSSETCSPNQVESGQDMQGQNRTYGIANNKPIQPETTEKLKEIEFTFQIKHHLGLLMKRRKDMTNL